MTSEKVHCQGCDASIEVTKFADHASKCKALIEKIKGFDKKWSGKKQRKRQASSNKRKMYASNQKAKEWLWVHGYSDIWVFGHGRFFKDPWHIADMACFDRYGVPTLVQVKTNKFGKISDIKEFTKGKKIKVLILNSVDDIGVKARLFRDGEEVLNDDTIDGEELEILQEEEQE